VDARGRRRYGILNLAFAGLYAALGYGVVPSRHLSFSIGLGIVCVLVGGSGVALVVGARGARAIAMVACCALLAACLLTVGGLALSSAYLMGVYDGFGRGAALVCLAFAALVVELTGLLPLFELRFLVRSPGNPRS
jgi:hypothetical protein